AEKIDVILDPRMRIRSRLWGQHKSKMISRDLVTPWLSVNKLIPLLQQGDRIEFGPGEGIGGVFARHWALYAGMHNGVPYLIHLYKWDGQQQDYEILYDKVADVAAGRLVRRDNSMDVRMKPFQVDRIMHEAEKTRKEGRAYDLLQYNCEHFVNGCRYGVEISEQVEPAQVLGKSVNVLQSSISTNFRINLSFSSGGGSSNSSGSRRQKQMVEDRMAATDAFALKFGG
ncbi:hypothetical protein PENTCL1PPCAC_18780, partial [Pristionchus entomophagus]